MKSKKLKLLSLLAVGAMLFACGNTGGNTSNSSSSEETSQSSSTGDTSSSTGDTSSEGTTSSDDTTSSEGTTSSEDSSSSEEGNQIVTIAEFLAAKDTVNAKTLTGTVTAVASSKATTDFMLTDDTGSVYCFTYLGVEVGDVITVSGVYGDFYGFAQLTNATLVGDKTTGEIEDARGTAIEITAAELITAASASDHTELIETYGNKYVTVYGGYLLKNGNYYGLADSATASSYKINLYVADNSALDSMLGDEVVFSGYIFGSNSSKGTVKLMSTDYFNVDSLFLNANSLENQTFDSEYQKGSFTIKADADHSVVVDANKKTFEDVSYTKRIKLGGTGTADYRSIHFTLENDSTVDFDMLSSNGESERTVNIYKVDGENEEIVNTLTVVGSKVDGAYQRHTLDLTAGSYYFCSASSGLNVYGVRITEKTQDGGDQGDQEDQKITIAKLLEIGSTVGEGKTTSEKYTFTAVVTAVSGKEVTVTDETGSIIVYNYDTPNLYMDYEVTITGAVKDYYGVIEIVDFTLDNFVAATYEVTFGTMENGSVSASKVEGIAYGEKVTLTVSPSEGYKLNELYVNGTLTQVIDGSVEITLSEDVSVDATFVSNDTVTVFVPADSELNPVTW